jgi:hypothetical protein
MPKAKVQNQSGFKRFLIFTGISLLVIVIFGALIYWQWQSIS